MEREPFVQEERISTLRYNEVLYTNQKLKKAKTWHDGILKHSGSGTKAVLYDDKGSRLDTIHIRLDDIVIGEQLESDRYFILVEDVKKSDDKQTITETLINVTSSVKPAVTTLSRARCAGLKRKNTGFMPPRVVKQPCFRDPTEINHECQSQIVNLDHTSNQLSFNSDNTKTVHPKGSTNLPPSNVGRNLMNMYNRYGSKENSSSQDSCDGSQSMKKSSPWSVYGSKNRSPDVGGLFGKLGESDNSVNGSNYSSPTLNSKHIEFSDNLIHQSPKHQSKAYYAVENDRPIQSTDKSGNVSNLSKLTTFEKERKCDPVSNIDNGKLKDLINPSQHKHENDNSAFCSIVKNDLVNTQTSVKLPDKRNMFQIMKLLGKKEPSDEAVDSVCNETNQSVSFAELEKTIKSVTNITKQQIPQVKSPRNGKFVSSCDDHTSTDGNNMLTDVFINKNKTKNSEGITDESGHIVDNSNDIDSAPTEPCIDSKNTLNNCHSDVLSNQVTGTGMFSEDVDEENNESEDLVVSFQLNFSPLSIVTDSGSEMGDDNVYDNDKMKYSGCDNQTCDGLLDKSSSEMVEMPDKTVTDRTVNSKLLSDVPNESSFLGDGLGCNQQKHCDIMSIDNLPENQADHSVCPEVNKQVDDYPDNDYDCHENIKDSNHKPEAKSDEIVNDVNDSLKDSYNEASDEESIREENDRNTIKKDEILLDHDNVTENEINKKDVTVGNLVEKSDVVVDYDNMIENSESTVMTSQDTMEFGTYTMNDESQNFIDITETVECVTRRAKVSDTQASVSDSSVCCNTLNSDSQLSDKISVELQNKTNYVNTKGLNSVKNAVTRFVEEELQLPDMSSCNSSCSHIENIELQFDPFRVNHALTNSSLRSVNSHPAQRVSMRETNILPQLSKLASTTPMDSKLVGDENPLSGVKLSPDVKPPHPRHLFGRKMNRTQTVDPGLKSSCIQEHSKSKLNEYSLPYVSSARVSKFHFTGDTNSLVETSPSVGSKVKQTLYQQNRDSFNSSNGNMIQLSPFQTLSDSDISTQSTPYLYSDKFCFKKSTDDLSGEESSAIPQPTNDYNHEKPPTCMLSEEPLPHISDEEEIYRKLYQPRIMFPRKDDDADDFDDNDIPEFDGASYANRVDTPPDDFMHKNICDKGFDSDFNNSDLNRCWKTCDNLRDKYIPPFESNDEQKIKTCMQHNYFRHMENNTQYGKQKQSTQDSEVQCGYFEENSEVVNSATRWQMFMASQNSDDDIDLVDIADKIKNNDKVKEFIVLQSSPGLYNAQSNQNVDKADLDSDIDWRKINTSVNVQNKVYYEEKTCNQQTINMTRGNGVDILTQRNQRGPLTSDDSDKIVRTCNDSVVQSNNQYPESLFSCDSLDDMLEDDNFEMDDFSNSSVKPSVVNSVEQRVPETETTNSVEFQAISEGNPREMNCVTTEIQHAENNSYNSENKNVLSRLYKDERGDHVITYECSDKDKLENDGILFVPSSEEALVSANNVNVDVIPDDKQFIGDTILSVGLNDNKENTMRFSLDESLDLSFDSFEPESKINLSGTKKKQAAMRIGWKPPTKVNITQTSQDVTKDMNNREETKESDLSRRKPNFKCLRLISDKKIDTKSTFKCVATNGRPISEEIVENKPYVPVSDTCPLPGFAAVSKEVETVLCMNSNGTHSNLQGQPHKQIADTNYTQRFKLPSTNSPMVSNSLKHLPKIQPGQVVSQTELRFPGKDETEKLQNVVRQVFIPATFPSINSYKHVITAALTEYMNTHLLDAARRYHHALSKVDISTYCETQSKKSRQSVNNPNPACQCGVPSKMICVKKEGPNCGRYFYACSANRNQQCKWADENRKSGCTTSSRRKICDVAGLNQYMKSQHIPFYGECQIIKRTKESMNKYFKASWMRNKGDNDLPQKKQTLLKLPYKGKSSMYAKDDIWVISHQLDFNPTQTFIAKSTYYGPSSSLEVEIEPLYGYCPSNWQNGVLCHAILATNAAKELSCLDNIQAHIQAQSPPVLSYLLNRKGDNKGSVQTSSKGFQVPRSVSGLQGAKHIHLHSEQLDELSQQYINLYRLNADQTEALRRVSNMFSVEKSQNVDNVLLIHGVFGAGKSFLLSVMVLFLVEVFSLNDSASSGQPFPWKLLISSTTNVAVDRILNGLLDLGFEDFVRVGSVKKIAKPVLPYSVHASGTDNQELKDLQEMLRSGELTNAEKSNVRQSIEKHRRGENKKKLGRVRVVGATCAACSLTCLNQMEFPLVLLDECSQMTEPASLLPVAKFGCQKLLLVGDPKQLDPTIQGCEAAHQCGLEQTLFDRLVKMGCMPTLLRTQYRCHPNISAISNNLFYGGMLVDGVSTEQRQPLLDFLPTVCCYDVHSGQECCESFGSYYNECEAQFVVFLLKVLLTVGIEPTSVGVITLYKSQMARISDLLTGQGGSVDMKGIQVSTVDAFQGGERDIIILSTVRTDACGFIDNDKRMNVALSRAKHHLLIVGHAINLSRNLLWNKVLQHCKSYVDGIQSEEISRRHLQDYLKFDMDSNISQKSEENSSDVSSSLTEGIKPVRKKCGRKRKLQSDVGKIDKENSKTDSIISNNVSAKGVSTEAINTTETCEVMDDDFEFSECSKDSVKKSVTADFLSDKEKNKLLQNDGKKTRKRKRITDRLKLVSDHSDVDIIDKDLPTFPVV